MRIKRPKKRLENHCLFQWSCSYPTILILHRLAIVYSCSVALTTAFQFKFNHNGKLHIWNTRDLYHSHSFRPNPNPKGCRECPTRTMIPMIPIPEPFPNSGSRFTNTAAYEYEYETQQDSLEVPKRSVRRRLNLPLPWPWPKKTEEKPVVTVRNVHELRQRVLEESIPLKNLDCDFSNHTKVNATTATTSQLANHAVLQLITKRIRTNSTPGNRAEDDTAHLSLAIEGGGMRGAHCAGMTAAIASLGMSDAFDSVYGSSAGSIVGAYFVSRQLCVDVYTRVLPAAGPRFASRGRVMGNVGVDYVNDLVARLRERGTANVGKVDAEDEVPVSVSSAANVTSSNVSKITGRLSSMASIAISKVPILNRTPVLLARLRPYFTLHPGMNLTFVLDGIMNANHGLRPLDMDAFRSNDRKQPLYIVSSTVRGGKLETVAFNSKERDFFDLYVEGYEFELVREGRIKRSVKAVKRTINSALRLFGTAVRKSRNGIRILLGRKLIADETSARSDHGTDEKIMRTRRLILQESTTCPENSGKKGLFACLESSMLVPGAAGPPVKLLRSKHRNDVNRYGVTNMTNICFDAFCYEPIPYRSAVENGATHVVALRSRPDGCYIEVEPATYEKLVAPVYFRRNGLPLVAGFFESGGSQYRYLEDVLTLDEGLVEGIEMRLSPNFKGVKVPPPDILFGSKEEIDTPRKKDVKSWKTAHLFPIVLPANTPELPSLTQEKREVLEAVRDGYAAAFDVLAPIAGLNFDPSTVDSKRIAEMVFPDHDEDDMYILENPVQVKGEVIESKANEIRDNEKERKAQRRFVSWLARKRQERAQKKASRNPFKAAAVEAEMDSPGQVGGKADSLDWLEAEALLAALPGFQRGKLTHLSGGLRSRNETSPFV